jgi:hypothetical protein
MGELCAAIVGHLAFFARIFVLVLVVVLEDEPTNNEKTELSRWNFSNEDPSQSLLSTPSRTREHDLVAASPRCLLRKKECRHPYFVAFLFNSETLCSLRSFVAIW